jgi:hypothetical protein
LEGLAAASAQIGPSEACERLLDEVRATYAGSVPFEVYWSLPVERLPYDDRAHFRRALAASDYMVTGFATGPDGRDLPAAAKVAGIGMPLRLTRLRGTAHVLPEVPTLPEEGRLPDPLRGGLRFSIATIAEDEVWEFWSSTESWRMLMGRGGLALVRDRTVVDAYVTIMN